MKSSHFIYRDGIELDRDQLGFLWTHFGSFYAKKIITILSVIVDNGKYR